MNLLDNSVVYVIIIIRIMKNKEGNDKDGLCVSKAMSKIWRASKHHCPYSHYVEETDTSKLQ